MIKEVSYYVRRRHVGIFFNAIFCRLQYYQENRGLIELNWFIIFYLHKSTYKNILQNIFIL